MLTRGTLTLYIHSTCSPIPDFISYHKLVSSS